MIAMSLNKKQYDLTILAVKRQSRRKDALQKFSKCFSNFA